MPSRKEPLKLKLLCLNSFIESIEDYWLAIFGDQIKENILDAQKAPLYVLGPFEDYLNDESVNYIIRHVKFKKSMTNIFYLLFHNRLKHLNLNTFHNAKLMLQSGAICEHIGNNCFVCDFSPFFSLSISY